MARARFSEATLCLGCTPLHSLSPPPHTFDCTSQRAPPHTRRCLSQHGGSLSVIPPGGAGAGVSQPLWRQDRHTGSERGRDAGTLRALEKRLRRRLPLVYPPGAWDPHTSVCPFTALGYDGRPRAGLAFRPTAAASVTVSAAGAAPSRPIPCSKHLLSQTVSYTNAA